ncbi:hypothetical protein DFH07DRAFT_967056 [Mycena maculata]|uniref:Uncharacterized protein n=1 Tax=Mycena maculata TaxID=230809 RepID=A0AAD7MWY5_9AGAR|nr:hypothetical protein DFH07DRAFT_967056 [Mycena maculata]
MFLLGTSATFVSVGLAGIVINLNKALVQGSANLPHIYQLYNSLFIVNALLMVANNLVTDLLFLYRCYIIWGSRKTVLILPGICMLATAVVGCISAVDGDALSAAVFTTPYITATGTNVILMCLTAGRIWYKKREALSVNGNTFRTRYSTAIAMILESGAIYCLSIILFVIAQYFVAHGPSSGSQSTSVFFGVTAGLWSQIVNIAPTLILVRVGMGHCQWIQDPTPADGRLVSQRRITDLKHINTPYELPAPVLEIK